MFSAAWVETAAAVQVEGRPVLPACHSTINDENCNYGCRPSQAEAYAPSMPQYKKL